MAGDSTLPLDIWTEILLRLPPKTLVRFRCVSKSLLSLIHNPYFISLHKNRFNKNNNNNNNNNGNFLLSWETHSPLDKDKRKEELRIRVRTIDDDNDELRIHDDVMSISYPTCKYYQYMGCVDGLVLFRSDASKKFYLFNPSIRKFLPLPKLPPNCPRPYDPSYVYLGFDPVTSDYKVLRIPSVNWMKSSYSNPGYTAIYALTTGCWKLNSCIEVPAYWSLGRSVFAKGVMHWISSTNHGLRWACTHIVTFDFATEVFSYTKLPLDLDASSGGGKIIDPCILRDSLALFCVSCTSSCIWVMGKHCDNGSKLWSKMYCCGVSEVDTFHFYERSSMWSFLYLANTEKFLLVAGGAGRVKSNDPKNHTMKDLHISVFECVMSPYMETLVLLNHPCSTSSLLEEIHVD